MSYVRTKYGRILKLTEKGCIKEIYGTMYAFLDKGLSHHLQNGFEIIDQADTIEELCDEFVQFLPNGTKPCIVRNKMPQIALKDFLLTNKLNQWELYGAIWTDKGLIYVAKMNDKGELELL